jgi:signal transduction histidine kinase
MKYTILQIVFYFNVFQVYAQSGPLVSRRYTEDDGLPQNSVKSIAQDENGFIWLATEDGLVRFDGHTFKVFNQGNLNASSNRFTHIERDCDDGKLYATNNNLEVFLIVNGMASRDLTSFRRESAARPSPRFQDTFRYGMLWYDKVFLDPESSVKIRTSEMEYYRCFQNRLEYFSNNVLRSRAITTTPNPMAFFRLGNELFYLEHHKLNLRFEKGVAKSFKLMGEILSDPKLKDKSTHLFVLPNKRFNMTVLIRLDKRLYLAHKLSNGDIDTKLLLKEFDFVEQHVATLLYDESNSTLWLGSTVNGLFKFSPRRFTTVSFEKKAKNESVCYYGQTAYTHKSVVTPLGHILGIGDLDMPICKKISHISKDPYSIITDSTGNIWVKEYLELSKYTHNFQKIGTRTFGYGDQIKNLYEGTDRWVYVGLLKSGLVRIHRGDKAMMPQKVAAGLKNVSFLIQQSRDTLLVGTSKGLFKLSLRSFKVFSVKGLQNLFIRSIYISKDNKQVWVTTQGSGIYLLEGNRITKFPLDRDGYLASTHCIVEDGQGYFWMTTNRGLFQVSKNDLLNFAKIGTTTPFFLFYNKESGFNINEFNGGCQPCGVKLDGGTISFPSMNGMVFFRPDAWSAQVPDKEIFIDGIKVDSINLSVASKIQLGHDYEQLRISVASPYYGNFKNVRLYYNMTSDKSSGVWYPVSSDGVIVLPNYRTGSYRLTIRKTNGFGANNQSVKSIEILVIAAWYETWWFLLTLVALFSLAIILSVRLRTQSLEKKNRRQEILIKQRTEYLQVALDNLNTSQNNLSNQMALYTRLLSAVGHDIRTPLYYLTLSSKRLHERLTKKSKDQSLLLRSKSNFEGTEQIFRMTTNLLEFIKLWTGKENVVYERINLYEVVNEKILVFFNAAKTRRIRLLNRISTDLFVITNLEVVAVILHNLIDNAIKVTRKGDIIIEQITDYTGRLHVVVNDSGFGMEESLVSFINQIGVGAQIKDWTQNGVNNNGMGLRIVLELSFIINIQVFAKLNESKGTSVHMIFPNNDIIAEV